MTNPPQDRDPRQTGFHHSYSPMEMARPSHLWRPQRWFRGAPSFLQGRESYPGEILDEELRTPVVLREAAYQMQDGNGERTYIAKPGTGRERGGTSRGGVFVCLPDQTINRYEFPPPNIENPTKPIEPEGYVVHAPRVYTAWGLPDLIHGSADAYSWRAGIQSMDPSERWCLQRRQSQQNDAWNDVLCADPTTQELYSWGLKVPRIDDRIPPTITIPELSTEDVWSAKLSWEQTRLWEAKPTGLFSGGGISINVSDQLVVDPGIGTVMNSYDSPNSTVTQTIVEFTGGTVAIAHPAARRSFVLIDALGNIVQQTSIPTPTQRRDMIILGAIFTSIDGSHDTRAQPVVINYVAHGFHDFVVDVLNYFHIINGGKVAEESPLYLSMESAVIWSLNANWHVNKKDPHRITKAAEDPILFGYVLGDGSLDSTAPEQYIDPTTYDPGGAGVPTTIPNPGRISSIQRLYMNAIGEYWILYGQNTYDNFLEAEAAILTDETNTIIPDFLEHAIHLGWIVAEKDSTDWAQDKAKFVPLGQGGSSGGGGPAPAETFLDLTDTPSSYSGFGGDLVAVKSAEDGLEFVTNPGTWPDPFTGLNEATPNTTVTSTAYINSTATVSFALPAGYRGLVNAEFITNALLSTGSSVPWVSIRIVVDGTSIYSGTNMRQFLDGATPSDRQGTIPARIDALIPATGATQNVVIHGRLRRDSSQGNFISYHEALTATMVLMP